MVRMYLFNKITSKERVKKVAQLDQVVVVVKRWASICPEVDD